MVTSQSDHLIGMVVLEPYDSLDNLKACWSAVTLLAAKHEL